MCKIHLQLTQSTSSCATLCSHKFTVVAIFVAYSVAAAQEANRAEVIKKSLDAVVLIITSDASMKEIGQGSGFIVSADGKIVTNHHAIKRAQTAVAKLSNGAFVQIDGILRSDADRDIAILKVSGNNLPTGPLGDSEKLSIGDGVYSPLGLQNTVSEGIISAIQDETPTTKMAVDCSASLARQQWRPTSHRRRQSDWDNHLAAEKWRESEFRKAS